MGSAEGCLSEYRAHSSRTDAEPTIPIRYSELDAPNPGRGWWQGGGRTLWFASRRDHARITAKCRVAPPKKLSSPAQLLPTAGGVRVQQQMQDTGISLIIVDYNAPHISLPQDTLNR